MIPIADRNKVRLVYLQCFRLLMLLLVVAVVLLLIDAGIYLI